MRFIKVQFMFYWSRASHTSSFRARCGKYLNTVKSSLKDYLSLMELETTEISDSWETSSWDSQINWDWLGDGVTQESDTWTNNFYSKMSKALRSFPKVKCVGRGSVIVKKTPVSYSAVQLLSSTKHTHFGDQWCSVTSLGAGFRAHLYSGVTPLAE